MKTIINALFIFLCCSIEIEAKGQKVVDWDSLYNYIPSKLEYDTLKGDFLYENLINAYYSGDEITKRRNFIIFDSSYNHLYKDGIIIYLGPTWFSDAIKMNRSIHYDSFSVFHSYSEMRAKEVKDGDGTVESPTNIEPFCGAYYKKYYLEIEVLYLGLVKQRVPLFMDCNDVEKYRKQHHNKDYQIIAIPTYLITHVFNWKEL